MKLFQFLCKRTPQNPFKVPLAAPRLPLKLRNSVRDCKTGRGARQTDTQEIINLLSALKKSDFNEQHCQKEIAALKMVHQKCADEYKANQAERKSVEIKTGRDLNAHQLNKILKKIPTY